MKQGGVAGVIFHQRITKLIHDDEISAVDQSQVVVHGLLLPRLLELGGVRPPQHVPRLARRAHLRRRAGGPSCGVSGQVS